MNKTAHFALLSLAIRKLHPGWSFFLAAFLEKIKPFWLGTHPKDQVNFIHLIGYGKKHKAKAILIELMELLVWESEMVILWDNRDNCAPSQASQILSFQESYPVFPKIIITDFLHDFFAEIGYGDNKCREFQIMEDFLINRKTLDFSFFELAPSDAQGSLVISFLDSFGDCDFVKTRLILQFLLHKKILDLTDLRNRFIPEELVSILKLGYIQSNELVFFSKDIPHQIGLAFDLVSAKVKLELIASKQTGMEVRITFGALDYFLTHIFHKRLGFSKLFLAMEDFFRPVFNPIPRMLSKTNHAPKAIEVDFKAGWKYHVQND